MGKGQSFERAISKQLSLWLSGNTRDDLFWRTHTSGARFTSRLKRGKNTAGQSGDIVSTDLASNVITEILCFELKAHKNIDLWSFVTEAKSGIRSFWEQTVREATESKRLPVLIAKQNNRPILFVCNQRLTNLITIRFSIDPAICFRARGDLPGCYAFLWDEIRQIPHKEFFSLVHALKDVIAQELIIPNTESEALSELKEIFLCQENIK